MRLSLSIQDKGLANRPCHLAIHQLDAQEMQAWDLRYAGDQHTGSMDHAFASPRQDCDVPGPDDLHWAPFVSSPSPHEHLSSAEQLLQESCEGLLELQKLPSPSKLTEQNLCHHHGASSHEPAMSKSNVRGNMLYEDSDDANVQYEESRSELIDTRTTQAQHATACMQHEGEWHRQYAAETSMNQQYNGVQSSVRGIGNGHDQISCRAEDEANHEWDAWVAECLATESVPCRSCSPFKDGFLMRDREVPSAYSMVVLPNRC